MAVSYDANVDYQAKINEAVAAGNTTAAAQYEQQRNAKIADMNKAGTNTGGWTQTNNYSNTGVSSGTSNATSGGSSIPTTYNASNNINYAGYDTNYDYQARINEIVNGKGNYDANGNFVPGAWGELQALEAARNAKLVDMGKANEQTSIYGASTWTSDQIDYNRNTYGSALAPQSGDSIGAMDGGVVRVGANGKAPAGLKVGTLVSTQGGTYRITAVNADGTYQSERIGGASATDPSKNKTKTDTAQTPTTGTTGSTDIASSMQSLLDAWKQSAEAQANGQVDYATQQAIAELQRALDDAQPQFQQQQNQTAIDEAKALDNSALYAEARGDKGGIGQAQYNQIMADALKAKQEIQTAQTQLSTDTARQIADLRARGEFEKADKLLEISQNYLSKAIELQQWQANYNLSLAEFEAELAQWQQNYELEVANLTGTFQGQNTLTKQSQLASVAGTLLSAGIMPNAEQLAALGMTSSQAQEYILALKLASGSGGGLTQDTTTGYTPYSAKDTYFTGTNPTTDKSKLDYSEDEGIFTWNGKAYNLTGLVEALEKADLSTGTKQTLQKKLAMYGFEYKFD